MFCKGRQKLFLLFHKLATYLSTWEGCGVHIGVSVSIQNLRDCISKVSHTCPLDGRCDRPQIGSRQGAGQRKGSRRTGRREWDAGGRSHQTRGAEVQDNGAIDPKRANVDVRFPNIRGERRGDIQGKVNLCSIFVDV
jgi:hypothetical protein